ncbi:MAG: cyclase family protein [Actinomycetota bacterium]
MEKERMGIIDASGPIYEGMWSYGEPFPEFRVVDIKEPDWVEGFSPKSQAFEGFCMLTGTYIDGPSHAYGLQKSYPMSDIPIEKLFDVDAYVYKFDLSKLKKEGRRPVVNLDDVLKVEKNIEYSIPQRSILIFATGWGSHWGKSDYLPGAWFFEREAVEYIVGKKPFIMAMDTPYVDCLENERGSWELIYGNDIILAAPLVNIEKITRSKVKIYICPLKILNTTGLPCRIIIGEQ